MKNERKQLKMGSLLALILFGVFAACVLLVLWLGADGYQRMTERDRRVYENRTAVQYLTTRVRQADGAESIFVEDFMGLDALVLTENFEDEVYETKLYCHDGWMMELYTAKDAELSPADGEKILQAEEIQVSLEDGLLQVMLTLPDGDEEYLTLQLRSGREVLS
ncbi:MAG: DUF4860 domain-containing protein [Anaerotignum sp.]|nr:DUF4860 domain-containing protein [Anaerotignum sp.]